MPTQASIKNCSVQDLYRISSSQTKDAATDVVERFQILDVREGVEYSQSHMEPSLLTPLSNLKKSIQSLDRSAPTYLLCRSGGRATQAATQLQNLGFDNLTVVTGGMQEWEKANLPTIQKRSNVWAMERQVRFGAGLLVVTGLAASTILDPNWIYLSGFVGAGLLFSSITNTCGMAVLLGKMPWNQAESANSAKNCSR